MLLIDIIICIRKDTFIYVNIILYKVNQNINIRLSYYISLI